MNPTLSIANGPIMNRTWLDASRPGRALPPRVLGAIFFSAWEAREPRFCEPYEVGACSFTEVVLFFGIRLQVKASPSRVPFARLDFAPALDRSPVFEST